MDWFLAGITAAAAALIAFIIYAAIEDNKGWQQFKKAHACKVVTRIRGDVFITNGIDSKGNMTTGTAVSPDKTGWLCNDGVTYYR